MRAEPRAIEPFGFFTLESLRAGWYLGWRLLVFTVPVVVVPLAIAAVLGASGLWLAGALVALGGMVLAMAVAVRFTNRVAAAWTRREYGRPLPAGVWWSVSWRVLLVSVPLSLLLTPLGLFSEGPLFVSGVLDLVFPVIGLLLAAFYVVGTLQSYGWALSTAVADRFSAAGLDTEPDLLSEPARRDPAPARERPAVPRPANPAPARPAAPSAAASRSASRKIRFGDFPPNSRETRFRLPAEASTISLPTSPLPVNATLSTSGWRASGAPAVSP